MNRSRSMVLAAFSASAWFMAAVSGIGGCEGGTSSETVGVVLATPGNSGISGRTDAGNSVSLYAADYQPHLGQGFAKSDTADRDGAFAFADLEPGRYQLLARHLSDGKAALITDLVVPSRSEEVRRAALEPTGILSGRIADDSAAFLGTVFVPGTPFFGKGDSLMRYSLEGLPVGRYRVMKTWKLVAPCESGKVCGEVENRRDSADVGIRPGADTIW